MGQIFVDKVDKFFGATKIIDCVSFVVGSRDIMGLVGSNGCGKSTLLKMIVGELEHDFGTIEIEGKSSIGYFAQDRAIDITQTPVFEYMRQAFAQITQSQEELKQAHNQLENEPENKQLIKRVEKLQAIYESQGGYEIDHKIERILSGLSFTKEDHIRPISSLSGGERARLQLARILAQEPDTLILDEPTNHLDIDAVIWLEEFLSGYNGSVLIVSHDRFLLDRICTKIALMQSGKVRVYKGNYTFAKNQSEIEREQTLQEIERQEEFLDKAQRFISKFKGIGTEHAAAKARAMESRVNRLEIIDRPEEEKDIKLRIKSTGRTGEIVFKTKQLGMGFDNKELFSNVDVELSRGQKIAIIGPNGCGKTTFVKIILEKLKPTYGDVWTGYNVEPIFLEQELGNFDPEATVLDELMKGTDLLVPKARDHLASFNFKGDDVFKQCKVLSGGEISRLILSKLALIDANFLVMDEPTNHLDIRARTALEDTLNNYMGTVLIISHDRYFIQQIDARIWNFTGNTLVDTRQNLDEFLRSRKSQTASTKTQEDKRFEKPQTEKKQTLSKNKIKEIQSQIAEIEKKLDEMKAEKEELEKIMSSGDANKLTKEDFDRHNELTNLESLLLEKWESLSLVVEMMPRTQK